MQKNTWFGMRADENDIEQIKTLSKLLGMGDSQAVRIAITYALRSVAEIAVELGQELSKKEGENVTG